VLGIRKSFENFKKFFKNFQKIKSNGTLPRANSDL